MAKTALEMTQAEWKRYKPSSRRHRKALEGAIKSAASREEAIVIAQQAARLLKERFDAQKVVVFGSLAMNAEFTELSDIDLAAWGIPTDKYYKAVAEVTGLSDRYKIDLVDPELCRDSVKKAILEQGVEI